MFSTSSGLPLKMNGIHKTQSDNAHLTILYHVELSQSTALGQKRFNNRSPARRNLWLVLIWLTITLKQSTSCQANVIIVSLHITHIILIWYFTCLSGFVFLWYFPYSSCLVLTTLDAVTRYNCKFNQLLDVYLSV